MTKLSRSLALVALLAGAATLNVAPAQDKGKPVKKEDDKKAKAKKGGTVEVLENKAGKFYFKVTNADGKLLAMSLASGFAEKAEAVKALEELKEILETAKVTYPAKKAADKDDDEKMEKKDTKKEKKGGAE